MKLYRLCEHAPDGGEEAYIFSDDVVKAISDLAKMFEEIKKDFKKDYIWFPNWTWDICEMRDDIEPGIVFVNMNEDTDDVGSNIVKHWRRMWKVLVILQKRRD